MPLAHLQHDIVLAGGLRARAGAMQGLPDEIDRSETALGVVR